MAVARHGGKAVLVEMNSETDFVAKDASFVALCQAIAPAALASDAADVEALKTAKQASDDTVEEARAAVDCPRSVKTSRFVVSHAWTAPTPWSFTSTVVTSACWLN